MPYLDLREKKIKPGPKIISEAQGPGRIHAMGSGPQGEGETDFLSPQWAKGGLEGLVLSSLLQSADGETEARLGGLWLQLQDLGGEKKEATTLGGSLGEIKIPCEPGRPGEGRREEEEASGEIPCWRENRQHRLGSRAGTGGEHVTRERTGCTGGSVLHAGATCSGQGTALHAFKMLAESMNEM